MSAERPITRSENAPLVALRLRPITLREANAFVSVVHRHHGPVRGCKFALSVEGADDEAWDTHGVAIVGRPSARMLQDGWTCEVLRLATDGVRNVCSMLYGACARVAKAMGYRRIVTYLLESESGGSLVASGWTRDEIESGGGSWSRPSRPRPRQGAMFEGVVLVNECAKVRWSKRLVAA